MSRLAQACGWRVIVRPDTLRVAADDVMSRLAQACGWRVIVRPDTLARCG